MCEITDKIVDDLWSLHRVDIICRPSPKIDCRDQIKKVTEKVQKGFPALDESSKYEAGIGDEKLDFLRLTNSRYVVRIQGGIDPIELFVEALGLKLQTGLRISGGTIDNDPATYPVSIMKGADLMVSWHFLHGFVCEDTLGRITEELYAWHPFDLPIVPFPADKPR